MNMPFCAVCKEEFPVATEPTGWAMGWLRLLSRAPKRLRDRHRTEWDRPDYLCGNCYFDFLDAQEARA